MGTTADKLNRLEQTKSEIKTAINNTGCPAITDSDTFASYSDKINNYLVYQRIETNTGTTASGSSTYKISGFSKEPTFWALHANFNNTRLSDSGAILAAIYDGSHVYSDSVSRNGQAYAFSEVDVVSWSYSNGTITLSTSGSRNFRDTTYTLIAIIT